MKALALACLLVSSWGSGLDAAGAPALTRMTALPSTVASAFDSWDPLSPQPPGPECNCSVLLGSGCAAGVCTVGNCIIIGVFPGTGCQFEGYPNEMCVCQ
jgi:hypothetical protein